jgi:hypothetical protein
LGSHQSMTCYCINEKVWHLKLKICKRTINQ